MDMNPDDERILRAAGITDDEIEELKEATEDEFDELVHKAYEREKARALAWWDQESDAMKGALAYCIRQTVEQGDPFPAELLPITMRLAGFALTHLADLRPHAG